MKSVILTAQNLSLISEFALTLYQLNKNLIDVDDDDILLIMYQYAKNTQNKQLISIYLHLRAELSNRLHQNICNGHTVPRKKSRAA